MKKIAFLLFGLFYLSPSSGQIFAERMNNIYLQQSVQEIEKNCNKKINWSEQQNIGHIKCSGVEFQLTFDESKKLQSIATQSKNIRTPKRVRVGDSLDDLWFNYKKLNRIHFYSKANLHQEFEFYSFADETQTAYYSILFQLKNEKIEEISISYHSKLDTSEDVAQNSFTTSKIPNQEDIEIGSKIDDLWKTYSKKNLDIRIYHLPDESGNLTRFKKDFYVFESGSDSVLKFHLSHDVVDKISIEKFTSVEAF